MGLGHSENDVAVDEGDGSSCGGGGCGNSFGSAACSICLETVKDNGDRSLAKLQCGHQFHLDCIGSAFNIKGTMQCPNCRKIEKGQWLYANGSRSLPEFSMDDWAHDEDLYDLGYSEMSFGLHWCPFGGSVTGVPSSFDSSARAGSSVTSPTIPPYQGSNARARDRIQALQAYYQQQQPGIAPASRTPIASGNGRSTNHRRMAQAPTVASSSDQSGFYNVPAGTSGRNFQEAEDTPPSRFHTWERDSLNQVDRDSGWGANRQAASVMDHYMRSGDLHQRHGSERMSTQNR